MILTRRSEMLCSRICIVQIQPRKHALDLADHTDHTDLSALKGLAHEGGIDDLSDLSEVCILSSSCHALVDRKKKQVGVYASPSFPSLPKKKLFLC